MRGLWAIVVGVVGIAVISTAAVVLLAGRGPSTFPPDSPEAALQAYLEGFAAQDWETAYGSFSSDVQADVSYDEWVRAAEEWVTYSGPQSRRVVVDDVEVDGNEATLYLTLEFAEGGGLGGSSYSYPTQVQMVREDGAWKIDQPLVYVEPGPFPAPIAPEKAG
jgi:hypothetical protein